MRKTGECLATDFWANKQTDKQTDKQTERQANVANEQKSKAATNHRRCTVVLFGRT